METILLGQDISSNAKFHRPCNWNRPGQKPKEVHTVRSRPQPNRDTNIPKYILLSLFWLPCFKTFGTLFLSRSFSNGMGAARKYRRYAYPIPFSTNHSWAIGWCFKTKLHDGSSLWSSHHLLGSLHSPRAGGIFKDPQGHGTPWAPYYSHITPMSESQKDMGIVWGAHHNRVPLLGVPGIQGVTTGKVGCER